MCVLQALTWRPRLCRLPDGMFPRRCSTCSIHRYRLPRESQYDPSRGSGETARTLCGEPKQRTTSSFGSRRHHKQIDRDETVPKVITSVSKPRRIDAIGGAVKSSISIQQARWHYGRFFTSDASAHRERDSPRSEKEISQMMLQLHATSPSEFSTSDKLQLLEMCHRNQVSHHWQLSALMLELWKHIGRREQLWSQISLYHKLCKDFSDRLWDEGAQKARRDHPASYEANFLWELNLLLNHTLSPTLEQYRKKQELIKSLKTTLENATNGTLHTFGSCENGLWWAKDAIVAHLRRVRGSDVDMCLEIPNCNHKRQWLSKLNMVTRLFEVCQNFEQIRSALANKEVVSNISIISAKVPIAKVSSVVCASDTAQLYNRDNHNFCDISINNTVALDNTRLVKVMTKLDFRVVKLARFIKYWATCRCINNRAQGTLSSYTLILQLFFFLQNRSPPVLPLYKDIEEEAASTEEDPRNRFMTNVGDIFAKCGYLQQNNESLTQLLFDFFEFYSDARFQGGRRGVTVDLYTNEMTENNLGVLVMKCPITGKNVNPFTIRMWQSIYREFKRVHDCITEQRPISQLCINAPRPPLEVEAETQRRHTRIIRQIVMQATAAKNKPTWETARGATRLMS
ncbi:nucleotidyltransferase, putative [Babesia caballi]|uniref:Nucleotidyltransferase, putative n=1 Tax=Babesia caballi TaxID=5871 RepID=A0AAV4M0T6_BABCB|nr:nucleotidyltransferase, putative [Babesia caballi]